MIRKIIPDKFKKGDIIIVVAPSFSLSIVDNKVRDIANKWFKKEGLYVLFSKNSGKINQFLTSSIGDRINDLHEAFKDKSINGIFTAIGGFNANQLLSMINWELIKKNPKIFCGYSDITVLANAIYAKTGLITYIGPHYSTFGQKKSNEYTQEYFKKCFFNYVPFKIIASKYWSDDKWWLDQNNRKLIKNKGWITVNKGVVEGIAIGGNLSSFALLKGTEYMPDFNNSILFLEEEGECNIEDFDRELQSLIQQQNFSKVKGLIIGRFQKNNSISVKQLKELIKSKKELKNIPALVNVDFGHTNPMFTIPIGGNIKVVMDKKSSIEVVKH